MTFPPPLLGYQTIGKRVLGIEVAGSDSCRDDARMETPRPPIEVCQGNPDQIFNGYHRVVAASFRGETEIEAEVFPRSEYDFAFWR
jgi:hypothetical protein